MRTEPHVKRPRGGQKGVNLNPKHKDGITVGNIMTRLSKAARGEIDMTPGQTRAAEIYLSKTLPSLQSVEQTTINPEDTMSQDQLIANLKSMLDNPVTRRLLKQLLDDADKPLHEVKAA